MPTQVAIRAFLCLIVWAVSMHAHAGRNVGFTSYARAVIPPDTCASDSELKGCDCVELLDRFVRPTDKAWKAAVKKDDVFVLTLKTVWMGHFVPDLWPPIPPFRSQYALVSRAFQFGATSGSTSFDYSPESHKAGRVIYFSDDVRPGQFLNFGQIIVAGPTTYLGNPVAISLYAVEVDSDAESSRTSSLLSTLANIGTTVSPVASPVLSVLESIGTSLIRANGDDINLRYDTVTLDYRDVRGDLSASFLAYGDYILFRKESRDKDFDYSKIRYKPSNGRLYVNEDGNSKGECTKPWEGESRGDAYAVLQVNKQNIASTASYQTYEELKKAIEAAETTRTENIKELSDNLAFAIVSDRTYSNILQAIRAVEPSIEKKTVPTAQQQGSLKIRLGILEKAIAAFDDSKPKKAGDAGTGLSSRQIDILIGRLQSDVGVRAPEIERSGFKGDVVYQILQDAWMGK